MEQLIISLISNNKNYFVSPENYILSFFTIIGILVTLISISTSLTKQVRQDLITKYILKRNFILYYVIYLCINLLFSVSFFYLNYPIDVLLIFYVFMILYTFYFVARFILTLNRNTLYDEVLREYKKELKTQEKRKESKKNMIKSQFESLDTLIKNISFIQISDSDFIEETKIIKELFIFSINQGKEELFIPFYNNLVDRISNPKFARQMISLLYELKYVFFDNLRIIRLLQDLLYNLLFNQFSKIKELDKTLNTSTLYLKEFMDIRYRDKFIKCDINELDEFETLFNNTINRITALCELILNIDIDDKIRYSYFLEQIGNLNKLFEEYKHIHQIDFDSNYYSLIAKNNKTESEKELISLIDRKIKIIEKQKNNVKKEELDLLYLIMYYTENNKLDKRFFNIVVKLYNSEKFSELYYNSYEAFNSKLDSFNYDWFNGGAQGIAPFNKIKYNLVISYYNYVENNFLDLSNFSKEFYGEHTRYNFESEMNSLTWDFLNLFLKCDENNLKKFKKEALKNIKEQKKKYSQDEIKYIVETPLKSEFVEKFKEDCKKSWDELQEYLKKIFSIEYKDNEQNKIKNFFGIYKLFEKKWFLDSFDKNIGYARDTGNMFGRDQTHSKKVNIVNKIDETFNPKRDKEVIIDDLFINIKNNVEDGKEYYLFHNSKIDIYQLPNLTWIRDYWQKAELKINNSKIHIFFIHSNNTIMFKKGDFSLIQYNQGFEDRNEKLITDVELLTTDIEIQDIINSNQNSYKTADEVKQLVKIRIAEKFEIKRNDCAKIIRFVR